MGQSFRDLKAWQKAIELIVAVYGISKSFPKDELYGLTSQLRRAAVSVASNIAEGSGRLSTKEFVQFLSHARGSISEVQTQLIVAERLGYLDGLTARQMTAQADETGRILNGLISSLRKGGAEN